MLFDHISYVTTHDQLSDTVHRLGSRIGTTFMDGGIHPRFGTRNFTAPLLGGQYIEVVCPLDHPATEKSVWGKAVLQESLLGGGWFTWVFSTKDISYFEKKFGRNASEGHRTKPDGIDLKWKQIGVREISDAKELPFFIQWMTEEHPAKEGKPVSSISSICISDKNKLSDSWFKDDILSALDQIKIQWDVSNDRDAASGITSVTFLTPNGLVQVE